MMVHITRMGVIILVMGLSMVYPFLPGEFDAVAMPLATMVQLFGGAGLLLAPFGVLWSVYELRKTQRLHKKNWTYFFALASLITASIVITAVSLIVYFGISKVIGVLAFVVWLCMVTRWLPKLKLLRDAEVKDVNPIPFYLIGIPVAALLLQVGLANMLTEFSRNHAIANSSEFIRDIEAYHGEYGRYPISLAAMWKDYYPDVVGVEKFHYAPGGESYNLFFEQPKFLFNNIGTREWVVYNPNNDQRMFSHTAWFLLLSPEELERSQGWYAVHDAQAPNWKYFWFD